MIGPGWSDFHSVQRKSMVVPAGVTVVALTGTFPPTLHVMSAPVKALDIELVPDQREAKANSPIRDGPIIWELSRNPRDLKVSVALEKGDRDSDVRSAAGPTRR